MSDKKITPQKYNCGKVVEILSTQDSVTVWDDPKSDKKTIESNKFNALIDGISVLKTEIKDGEIVQTILYCSDIYLEPEPKEK